MAQNGPPFFANPMSFDAWMLGQRPVTEDLDFFKSPPMPPTILDLDPSHFTLTDESNYSSSCSSNSSGKDKLKQAQSQNWDYVEAENAVTELCASCSQMSITHQGHRHDEHNENKRIEDPIEKLCTLCWQLTL